SPGKWSRSRSSGDRFAGFPILVESVTFDSIGRAPGRARADPPSDPTGRIRRARPVSPCDRPGESEERENETMGRSSATLPASLPASTSLRRASPTEIRPKEGYRDTVEAIIVALILALVVRGFEAQAFVIPTGAMAPTLMGRHKELACPQCGFVYAVNASEEVELKSDPQSVHWGVCANCRYQARLDEPPSFQGHRL